MSGKNISNKAKNYLDNKPYTVVWIFTDDEHDGYIINKEEEYPDYEPKYKDVIVDYKIEGYEHTEWVVSNRKYDPKNHKLFIIWAPPAY